MTEELKQKAEGYAETLIKQKMANHDIFVKEVAKREIMNVYIAGATEATKELQEENKNLESVAEYQQSSNMKRYFEIEELEKQIEKMKCCFNCKHSRTEYEHCRTDKHEKWELAE